MPPCRNCKYRNPECHAHCGAYLKYVEDNEKYKAENQDGEVREYIRDRANEVRKRRHN